MSGFFRQFLTFILHLGLFGPLVLGVIDSSFFFLPLGNDLLVVALTVRNHARLPLYALMAATGSVTGVFLLHLATQKLGKEGLQKLTSAKRYRYLEKRITKHGNAAILLGCLAPPPFPFIVVVGITSALGYPRGRLLVLVFIARACRYVLIGLLAISLGRQLLRIAQSPHFYWTMVAFAVLCLVGSAISIVTWIRRSKRTA